MISSLNIKVKSHLVMLLFSLFVTGSFIFGKIFAETIQPELLTFFRFLLGALILGAYLSYTSKLSGAVLIRPWRYFVLGGIYSIYFVFMFIALRHTSTISTSAIFALMPFSTLILDSLLFNKKSKPLIWLALGLSSFGALFIIFDGSLHNALNFKLDYGELIFLIGTIVYSSYALLQPRLNNGENLLITTFGVLTAGAFILASTLVIQDISFIPETISIGLIFLIIYLAIFASIGTILCLNFASNKIPGTNVMAYSLLIPFWVLLVESFGKDGLVPAYTYVGIIPIGLGLLVLYRNS
jgi:drug/metabolite transporter (DMT)-like permease